MSPQGWLAVYQWMLPLGGRRNARRCRSSVENSDLKRLHRRPKPGTVLFVWDQTEFDSGNMFLYSNKLAPAAECCIWRALPA